MSTVRVVLEGNITDNEAFFALAKRATERVRAEEPAALAYEWFGDEDLGRFLIHELYQDEEAFLFHLQRLNEAGDMDAFLASVEIESVTTLGRVADPRVLEVVAQFSARQLHGIAGVTR